MSDKTLTSEEFLLISRELEIYHSIFSKIWNIGKPRFVDSIPTACVVFDRAGNYIDFQFNETFWNSILPYERLFVICHECLHIILNHGQRLKGLIPEIANTAADVVINELLVSGFGFERDKLDWVSKKGCWVDTVFKDVKYTVSSDRSMEYYYNLLKNDFIDKIKEALKNGDIVILDGHDGMGANIPDELNDMIGGILSEMNDGEKKVLDKSLNDGNSEESNESAKKAGSIAGNLRIQIKLNNIKHKRKWETVIKKWATKFIKNTDKDHEQWARINRRFTSISQNNMFLPSEMEVDERDSVDHKIKVVFFQDTSGSCQHLAERFFRAAKTLPPDRFEVELYCFDTEVYKTSLESGKLYGFGGTSFSVLESEVLKICKNNLNKYPRAIFVITDGYGDIINPAKPKNWHWFLSEGHATYCIPKQCNIYKLSDFE